MKARLGDLSVGIDGRQRLTIITDDDCRLIWDEFHDGDIRVDIKKWREKRSLSANAYCWVCIDKLAEKLNVGKTDIYRAAIREIGGVSTTVCVKDVAVDALVSAWQERGIGWIAEKHDSKLAGCTNLTLYYGSSVYDTKQMSQLIDRLIDECKEFGIETMPPAELAALKESWKS